LIRMAGLEKESETARKARERKRLIMKSKKKDNMEKSGRTDRKRGKRGRNKGMGKRRVKKQEKNIKGRGEQGLRKKVRERQEGIERKLNVLGCKTDINSTCTFRLTAEAV